MGACWHKSSSTNLRAKSSEWRAGFIDRAFLLRHARSFLFPLDSPLAHLPLQLLPRLECHRVDPHPARRLDVRRDVVRIEALLGPAAGTLHRRLENLRLRLHGVH